jgi:hypothetical protein
MEFGMYKKRHIEKVLKRIKDQFPILMLSGPRQVGKTTVLQQISKGEYTEVSFDDPILRNRVISDPNLFLKNNRPPLLLDEVQYVPELFPFLNMQVDRNRKYGDFLMTGSQAFVLMKNVSESLAGRVGILELQGISQREMYECDFILPFIPTREYIVERQKALCAHNDLWADIHRGYMPELVFNPHKDREVFYSSYVQTYIQRDVRQLTQVADESLFVQFMVSLAARSGELLNYESVAKDIGVSNETVKRWVSILQTSRIIYLLQPYSSSHLKRAIKTPKIYFMDTGLMAYLTRWPTPETLASGAKAGNFFETYFVGEIIRSFLNAGKTDLPLYFYRDRDGVEIDLVIEDGGILYPIEIKMSASPALSMAKSFAALDDMPNMVRGEGVILCRYERPLWLSNDVVALPTEYV